MQSHISSFTKNISLFFNHHNLLIFLFGSVSGMMLMLTGNSLNFWLTKEGISLPVLGLFTFTSLPYVIKFLIASLIDNFAQRTSFKIIPFRKIILLMNASIILLLVYLLSFLEMGNDIWLVALISFLMSMAAVSTDVILDSYRVKISEKSEEYGIISAMFVFGYRVGMFLASAGGIFLSIYLEWQLIYKIFSALVFVLISFFIFIYNDREIIQQKKLTIKEIIMHPWYRFENKMSLLTVVLFILLYKLADQVMTPMLNPFLFKHIGYDEYEMSVVVKTFGFVASIIGSIIGGYLAGKGNIKKCLCYFASLHSLSYLFYIYQNYVGYNMLVLQSLTLFGTITSGMCMTCYIAYIASLCGGSYSGSQYAFFSSIIGASRVILPSMSGNIVEIIGWNNFFILIFLLSIPGILIVRFLPETPA